MREPRKQKTSSPTDAPHPAAGVDACDVEIENWLSDNVAPAYDAHKADPNRAVLFEKSMANVRARIQKSTDITKLSALWAEGKASVAQTGVDMDSTLGEGRAELAIINNRHR